MSESVSQELIKLNHQLLHSIAEGDWATYESLCDVTLSAFEPEARGHLVEGMDFHRFYFDRGGIDGPHNTSICSPHVRLLGNVAVVSYIRLVQQVDQQAELVTTRFEETRVWHKGEHGWRNVHFHRSENK